MGEDVRIAAARAAFELVDDGVAVVRVDPGAGFPVVAANPGLERLTGRSHDSVVGHPLADLQPARLVAGFARRVEEVVRTGQTLRTQFVDETPAGRVILDASLCHLTELGDDPAHVLVVLRDVTALMRVNDMLDDVERATRTGTWTWDVTSGTVRWSSQLYALFGLDRDTFAPSLEAYLDRVHADDRDDVRAAIEQTVASGQPFDLHHRVVTPDAHVRRLHCTGRRAVGLDGRPVRMSGTAQWVDPVGDAGAA